MFILNKINKYGEFVEYEERSIRNEFSNEYESI